MSEVYVCGVSTGFKETANVVNNLCLQNLKNVRKENGIFYFISPL